MEPEEWNYNDVLAALSKAMNIEVDDTDNTDEDDDETMHIVGVKSSAIYSGGRKLPQPTTTKIYLDEDPGMINIDFDHNY